MWGLQVGEQDAVGVFGLGAADQSPYRAGRRVDWFVGGEPDSAVGGDHQMAGCPLRSVQERLDHFQYPVDLCPGPLRV